MLFLKDQQQHFITVKLEKVLQMLGIIILNYFFFRSLGSIEQYEGLTDDGLLNANVKFKNFLRQPIKAPRLLQFQGKIFDYFIFLENLWESSKEFDKIISAIGKNRKYLNDIFK